MGPDSKTTVEFDDVRADLSGGCNWRYGDRRGVPWWTSRRRSRRSPRKDAYPMTSKKKVAAIMPPPERQLGVKLCLAVTNEGVKAYGNRQAFKALAKWMTWLSKSAEAEHFECHVLMSMEDDESKFDGKEPRNAWVLLDKNLKGSFAKRSKNNTGFELTFMMVEPSDLKYMERFQKSGLLPDDWNKEAKRESKKKAGSRKN